MSIQAHSRDSNELIIFSVYQDNKGYETNISNHKHIIGELKYKGVAFKEVIGVYNGKSEVSIMAEIKRGYEDINLYVPLICILYNQESFLRLGRIQAHGLRKAELVYQGGGVNGIGYFRSVAKSKAIVTDAYTYDIETDTYYMCVTDYTQASKIQ